MFKEIKETMSKKLRQKYENDISPNRNYQLGHTKHLTRDIPGAPSTGDQGDCTTGPHEDT